MGAERQISAFRIALLVVFFFGAASVRAPEAYASEETAIRSVLDGIMQAYRDRDAVRAMEPYVRTSKLVVFDLAKTRQDIGYEANLEKTKAFMDASVGPITVDWSDLKITIDHRHAYVTALLLVDATLKAGDRLTWSGRTTIVLAKSGGRWLIEHEHDSVPLP